MRLATCRFCGVDSDGAFIRRDTNWYFVCRVSGKYRSAKHREGDRATLPSGFDTTMYVRRVLCLFISVADRHCRGERDRKGVPKSNSKHQVDLRTIDLLFTN
jgi:hypothetical protein